MEQLPQNPEDAARIERAQDFLDTHIFTELPEAEYMQETYRTWLNGDRSCPFWGRTSGDADSPAFGGEVQIDYMMPLSNGIRTEAGVFGSIMLDDRNVCVVLPDMDSAETVRDAVRVSEEPYSLIAVANALALVENHFEQRSFDRLKLGLLEEEFRTDEEN